VDVALSTSLPDANDCAPRGDVGQDDGIGADLGAVADLDAAENLGTSTDRDVVADGRLAIGQGPRPKVTP
jgi:hypothetical protein